MASGSTAGYATGEPSKAEDEVPAVLFKVEPEEGGRPGDCRATFVVPSGWAAKLAERPVATKGGLFDLRVGKPDAEGQEAVQTVFYSPRPERTAEAIAKVISRRIADPDGPDVECVVM
mmetsp:Transcript_107049/g.190231  ORF Transcript_107049/g.190231 Transcript_107049/m.190231 type:complete len:118 (-) Transcript_107049:85-438(-)